MSGGALLTTGVIVALEEPHECLRIPWTYTRTCSTFLTCPCRRQRQLTVMLILMLLVITEWRRVTTACTMATISAATYHQLAMTWDICRMNLRRRQRERQVRRRVGAEELLLLVRRVLYGCESHPGFQSAQSCRSAKH